MWLCSPCVLAVRHSRTPPGRCVRYASMFSVACQRRLRLHVRGDRKRPIVVTTCGVIRPRPAPQLLPSAVSTTCPSLSHRPCRSGSTLAPATPAARCGAGGRSMALWSVRSVTRLRMRRWSRRGKAWHDQCPLLCDVLHWRCRACQGDDGAGPMGLPRVPGWRRRQARRAAGATQERTLSPVACNTPCPHGQSPPQKQGRTTTPP